MQKDRKQIQILLYLVAPVVLLWLTFGASFSYELGKNGLHHINWGWIFQGCLPVIIISVWMVFYAVRMIRAERVRKNKNYMDLEY